MILVDKAIKIAITRIILVIEATVAEKEVVFPEVEAETKLNTTEFCLNVAVAIKKSHLPKKFEMKKVVIIIRMR